MVLLLVERVVEAVTALNTDLTVISTDNHVFSGGSIIFEGATDDDFETTLRRHEFQQIEQSHYLMQQELFL